MLEVLEVLINVNLNEYLYSILLVTISKKQWLKIKVQENKTQKSLHFQNFFVPLNDRENICNQPKVSLKQTRIYYHTNRTKVSAIWANGHDIRMDSSTTTSNILKVTSSAGCCFHPLYSQSSAVFSDLQSSFFFTTTPENPKCVLKWRSMFSSSMSGVPISPLGNLDNSVNKEKCPLLLPFRYSLLHFRKTLNQTSIFGKQFDSLV